MPEVEITRPIVRSFSATFAREAGAYVRSGGHAVLWETPTRAKLVLPLPREGDNEDLALWSILDLGKRRWSVARRGPLRGLATARVPSDCHDIVRHRAARDSIFPGPRRKLLLDCTTCGACCVKNRVVLEREDIRRFRASGRSDLIAPPYVRREDGKLIFRLTKTRRCKHLLSDNLCAIYPVRPNACREFPMGSESCLAVREEEFGWVDGLAR
jgi:Fe-S-cluster containining protein